MVYNSSFDNGILYVMTKRFKQTHNIDIICFECLQSTSVIGDLLIKISLSLKLRSNISEIKTIDGIKNVWQIHPNVILL